MLRTKELIQVGSSSCFEEVGGNPSLYTQSLNICLLVFCALFYRGSFGTNAEEHGCGICSLWSLRAQNCVRG